MRTEIGCVALLLGAMGIVTCAAANVNAAGVAGKRGLSPIISYALTLTEGEELMFTMDVPYIPAQDTPIVLAQAAAPGGTTPQPDYLLKLCQETESTGDSRSAMRGVDPAGWLALELSRRSNRDIINNPTALASIKTTLLEATTHGKITSVVDNTGRPWYRYDAEPNYIGNDKAVFMAEFEGKRYKIVVELHVFRTVNENNPTCPAPQLIKVTKPSSGASGYGAGYDLSSISVTFADLAGGAVGLTNASGITLDDNAANYNWFIDTTSWDNSEFLPTSNPYEWVAKAGTAAYGKMDMLSVLLHEYGHALGIEHSADNHDYMATTLTPGVRRMPSAEELALMQELVVQAKTALFPTPLPQAGEGQNDAPNPFPTMPLGGGFGLAFLGRLRSSRFGGMSIDAVSSVVPLHSNTQYAVAANATFTNLSPVLSSVEGTPAGWNTQGSVDIANGAATLNEVSTSQTRLSQVFMLNARDRYLSFKLSGNALDNLNGAPDDAFEVALLDANTGASLLSNDGLTRTDAIINLQGDGTQHAADCVTCIYNADGSRTYRVDLTGIAAGTVANLSFDLLGFGASNSSLTLSDIRVSGLPQLHDDVASLAEDNLLSFDPFAQADAQLRPLLVSHIVDTPTHGALAVNADGTFSYTPDLNYFGADSFSYRLSDGPLDSNLATVNLTVTSVNDAPVAADVALTTAEDTALVIALGAYASDVDSATLTTQIVTGPAHGVLAQNADGTYSYTPVANYNGADSFTYRVNDGALDSNIVTVSLTIAAVNDAPVAVSATVSGFEDTPYIFSWSDFRVSDVDSVDLAITINTLPTSGLLQYYDGLIWLEVIAGQRITKADIDAGFLCFGPDANESGFDGYSTTGTGNLLQDYASFTYQADDGPVGAQFIAPANQSDIVTMTIDIVPLADTPSLALSAPVDAYGATATRFSTGWEIAPNRNPTFTILPQSMLEGWNVVRETGDTAQEAFVIWSTGDKMKDANNTNQIVAAASGNGNNWLEIGNANGLGHQTWGIERTVDTRAGVTYNLSLDYAGRLGYGMDFTSIGIYVDGVRIGTYASTSPNTALNWEAVNFSFTGNGAAQLSRVGTPCPRGD